MDLAKLKKVAKRILAGVLLIVIPYVVWHIWGENILEMYWRVRINSYTISPERVVAEENPRRARELRHPPDEPEDDRDYYPTRDWNGALFYPDVVHPPIPYALYVYFFHQPFRRGLAFLHLRRSSNGNSRLVIVGAGREVVDFAHGGRDGDMLISAWTLFPGESRRVVGTEFRLSETLGEKRIFGGQCDEDDPSHFTIKYDINDKPGTIDGWLQPDDTVKLQIRDGPATKP